MMKNIKDLTDTPNYDKYDRDILEEELEYCDDIDEALYFNSYKNVIVVPQNPLLPTKDDIYLFDNVKKIYDFDGSSLFIEDKNSRVFFFSEPRDIDINNPEDVEDYLDDMNSSNLDRLRKIYDSVDNCIIFVVE